MTNKALTEQEVQEFCNRFGVFVAVDMNGEVYWYEYEPQHNSVHWFDGGDGGLLPFRILSTRPWTEQLWRPENQQPRKPK